MPRLELTAFSQASDTVHAAVGGWLSVCNRLLAQERLRFSEVLPLAEPVLALSRLLRQSQAAESWPRLLSVARDLVRSASFQSLPEAGPAATVALESLSGACQVGMIVDQEGSRRPAELHLVCGVLFRDVGWLSLLHHARMSRRRGKAHRLWLYRQHPAVGAAIWDAVTGAPMAVREIAGGHHERLTGLGLRGWAPGRQVPSVRLAAAATRLVELVRLAEGDGPAAFASLDREARTGAWDRHAVERFLSLGIALTPMPEEREATVDVRLRELHEAHLMPPAPHSPEPQPQAAPQSGLHQKQET